MCVSEFWRLGKTGPKSRRSLRTAAECAEKSLAAGTSYFLCDRSLVTVKGLPCSRALPPARRMLRSASTPCAVEADSPHFCGTVNLRPDVSSQPGLRPRQSGLRSAEQQISALIGLDRTFAGDLTSLVLAGFPGARFYMRQKHVALNVSYKHALIFGSASQRESEHESSCQNSRRATG